MTTHLVTGYYWLHPPPHTSVDPIDLIKFAEENSFPFRFPIHNKWWAHNRSTQDCSFHFIRDGLGCRLPESLIQLESMMPLGQFLFAIRSRRRRWMIESEVAYILLPMFHTDWRWWIGTHISSDHYIVTILLTNSFRFQFSNCPVYRSEQEILYPPPPPPEYQCKKCDNCNRFKMTDSNYHLNCLRGR